MTGRIPGQGFTRRQRSATFETRCGQAAAEPRFHTAREQTMTMPTRRDLPMHAYVCEVPLAR